MQLREPPRKETVPAYGMAYQTRQEVIEKLLQPRQSSSEPSPSAQPTSSNLRHKTWTDQDKFIQDNLAEVYEKLPKLEKQIWGKVIVMEGNTRTAKAYLRHPVITIDGSDTEFDGMRLGLSRFENVHRSEMAYEIFNEILRGIKLRIDPEGNIWAKRMCYSPVFLKPLYRNRANDLFIIDPRPVKVFDIKRFKEILVHELRQVHPDRSKLEKCCLVCLKFSVDHYDLLHTPCYVVLVHLVATELLALVLPKDDELSSPSSSFLTSSQSGSGGQSAGSGRSEARQAYPTSIPPPPPPPPPGHVMTALRSSGRAPRGGVFKRIIRKEEERNNLANSARLAGGQFHGSGFLRGEKEFDGDFETSRLYQRNPAAEKDYASMVDLRTIGQNSANHNLLLSPVNFHQPMGERVMSLENMQSPHFGSTQIRGQRLREAPTSTEKMRLNQRWRSQDSGLGSGTGSYGSK